MLLFLLLLPCCLCVAFVLVFRLRCADCALLLCMCRVAIVLHLCWCCVVVVVILRCICACFARLWCCSLRSAVALLWCFRVRSAVVLLSSRCSSVLSFALPWLVLCCLYFCSVVRLCCVYARVVLLRFFPVVFRDAFCVDIELFLRCVAVSFGFALCLF